MAELIICFYFSSFEAGIASAILAANDKQYFNFGNIDSIFILINARPLLRIHMIQGDVRLFNRVF